MGLAKTSIESEVKFKKSPINSLKLDVNNQPMGPNGPLLTMSLASSKTDHDIEKCYSDTDLRAKEAVIWDK